MKHSEILQRVKDQLEDNSTGIKEQLYKICSLLKKEKPNYDWVGFYFADHDNKNLYLGPFAGEPTEHKIIPFGKGICGQVAESHKSFLVDDVSAQDNYIACSLNVKSEIVVPLFLDQENSGQIDIDSNTPNAFTDEDEALLKQINSLIGEVFKQNNINLKSLWV